MKFSVKSTWSSARLGVITNVARLPHFEMETPHVLLYTKGGTVPHLTPDVIEMITKLDGGLHIPISQIMHLEDRIKLSKMDIAKFIGMSGFLTYCSFIDPGVKRLQGFHEKTKVPLFSKFGKKNVSATDYMNLIESLRPDMFLVLADGDTNSTSSSKRYLKSFNNTMNLYSDCLELYQKSDLLKQSNLLVAIEGGYNLKLREECSEAIGKGPAFGVVLDGFHDCSEKTSEIDFETVKPFVEASLKHIPGDKLRMIHGSWNPSVMLDLINCGVDLFDTSYPFIITEHYGALIFPNDENLFDQSLISQTNGVNCIKENGVKLYNETMFQQQMADSEESPCKKMKLTSNSSYSISMEDPRHVFDFSPILKNCTCHTCTHHTRAYIHHLVKVKELLGSNLIMIHNLHHYLQFLSLIRKSLSNGTFENLKNHFQAWTEKTNDYSLS